MAKSKRVLFVAGEVTPFAETSTIAPLARSLPEQLQKAGDFEARVMMPCYGNIDERKHSLHEVIRLSGTDVPMGEETETVTVKVASVPDVRLQVYLMDHDTYFGADKGTIVDGSPAPEDILRRALFFNRSALETIRKLRWDPDLIHSLGWMSGLVPLLMAREYSNVEYLGAAKSVFTPGDQDPGSKISAELAQDLDIPVDGNVPATFSDTGTHHADASILPPETAAEGVPQFNPDGSQRGEQLVSFYDQMLSEVPA
jgi:starch synthase